MEKVDANTGLFELVEDFTFHVRKKADHADAHTSDEKKLGHL